MSPPALRISEISGALAAARRAGDSQLAVSVLRIALGADGSDGWPGLVAASLELQARAAATAGVLLTGSPVPQHLDHVGLGPLKEAARRAHMLPAGTQAREEAMEALGRRAARVAEHAAAAVQSKQALRTWTPTLADFRSGLDACVKAGSEDDAREVLRLLQRAQGGSAPIPSEIVDSLHAEGGGFQQLALDAARGALDGRPASEGMG